MYLQGRKHCVVKKHENTNSGNGTFSQEFYTCSFVQKWGFLKMGLFLFSKPGKLTQGSEMGPHFLARVLYCPEGEVMNSKMRRFV